MTVLPVVAGGLRREIVIQQLTDAVGARGGLGETWTAFKTRRAKVVPLQGQEAFSESRDRSVNRVRFELRYVAGVTPKMRVSWDGRVFDIQSVINLEERNRVLHLMTEEAETTS